MTASGAREQQHAAHEDGLQAQFHKKASVSSVKQKRVVAFVERVSQQRPRVGIALTARE
jgi:hypothetical protein